MTKKIPMICLVIIMSVFTGCSKDNPVETAASTDLKAEKEFFSMDTYITLTAYGDNANDAVDMAEKRILDLNNLLSTGIPSSEVASVNNAGGGNLSYDSSYLLEKSIELNELTNGLFDITIYPLMELWGFTDKDFYVPSDDEINNILPFVSSQYIEYDKENQSVAFTKDNVKIDFGGIAKGYTSSEVIKIFKDCNVTCGIVNLGGNVQTYGKKPDGNSWKVGIQNPDKTKDYIGILQTNDKAVISSGDYERFFIQDAIKYHHIIDPSTGKPSNSDVQSVTVISDDGTYADGLSTSLFLMGKDGAVEFWNDHKNLFDMIIFTKDENIYITEGIEKDFSSSDYKIEVIH